MTLSRILQKAGWEIGHTFEVLAQLGFKVFNEASTHKFVDSGAGFKACLRMNMDSNTPTTGSGG
ncbi:hypothetical protein X801_02840, partial [Opisthorchis viverrini]